jgi:hypothetical protein
MSGPFSGGRDYEATAFLRFAFGKCEPDDVSFDLRKTMLNRRVTFIEAEVTTRIFGLMIPRPFATAVSWKVAA